MTEVIMGLQHKRSSETRRLVYDTAMRLFMQKGYENTSVDEIVGEADVAKGTFFRYFPAKVAVLEAWTQEWFAGVVSAAGIRNGEPLLDNALRVVSEMAGTDRAYLTLTGWLIVESHAANLRTGDETDHGPEKKPMREFLIDLMRRSVHSGAPPSGALSDERDLTTLAETLMNTWFGTILFCLDNPERDPGAMLADATRIWHDGAAGTFARGERASNMDTAKEIEE